MSVREYVGARYVPLFAEPLNWDATRTYEPLTVVLYQGNSYTSRQAVPANIDINNTTYWAQTGNYNAQIEQYRAEVQQVSDALSDVEDVIPSSDFDSTNTVKKYIDDSVDELSGSISDIEDIIPSSDFDSTNTVKKYIDDSVDEVSGVIPSSEFDSTNTVKKYIDDSLEEINDIIPSNSFSDQNTIKDYIDNKSEIAASNSGFSYTCDVLPYFSNTFVYTNPASGVQGGCVVGYNVIYAEEHNNTNCTLIKVNTNTRTIAGTNELNVLGHCNDLTYNSKENCIVAAGCDRGDGANSWAVHKINPNTLAIIDTIYPDINFWSLAYNEDDDIYYGFNRTGIQVMDTAFNVIDSYNFDFAGYTYQGICYKDGLIFAPVTSTKECRILTFDKNGKMLNNIFVGFAQDRVPEIEFLDYIESEHSYIIGCNPIVGEQKILCYKIGLRNNLNDLSNTVTYADSTNSLVFGDGTSTSNPCGAISFILSCNKSHRILTMRCNGTFNISFAITGFPVCYVSNYNNGSLTINGNIELVGIQRLYFNNMTINGHVITYETNGQFVDVVFNCTNTAYEHAVEIDRFSNIAFGGCSIYGINAALSVTAVSKITFDTITLNHGGQRGSYFSGNSGISGNFSVVQGVSIGDIACEYALGLKRVLVILYEGTTSAKCVGMLDGSNIWATGTATDGSTAQVKIDVQNRKTLHIVTAKIGTRDATSITITVQPL